MKHKLVGLLRVAGLIAVFVGALAGAMQLSGLHRASCPELYAADQPDYAWLSFVLAGLTFLTIPLLIALGGRLSGYRVKQINLLFLQITPEDRPHFRLTGRFGWGSTVLPPRTQPPIPYALYLLFVFLAMAALAAAYSLVALLLWRTGPARALLTMPILCICMAAVLLLPRRSGMDALSRVLVFRRNKDCLRAWACTLFISEALSRKMKLTDMPDEWFQTYPADLVVDVYVRTCMINGASRLMRQRRFAEAHGILLPLLTLKPAPDTHTEIACAILNGAICEAAAELPHQFLNLLDHDAVRYMLPPSWQPRLLTARYAHALFVSRDDAAAAALLAQIDQLGDAGSTDQVLLTILQEKAAAQKETVT